MLVEPVVQVDLPEDKVMFLRQEELLQLQWEEDLVLQMQIALLSDLQLKDKIHKLLMTSNREAIHPSRDISYKAHKNQ